MYLKIEWPNGQNSHYSTATTSNETLLQTMQKVMALSLTYDVIIDKGVITFCEKS
jgi:hypothetical protein